MRPAPLEATHRPLEDGERIVADGATLESIWTPGHASDHLCFRLVEENALFTGDVVLGAGTTVIPMDGDLDDYLHSLHRLLAMMTSVIYPAHGPAILDPAAKIQEYLEHRALRDKQILAGLEESPRSIQELVRRIYVDVPEYLHGAAAMSVHAHLRKLAREDRVRQQGPLWIRVPN
jgi:glyoxylase-like metal-dependent hydrolase (beta-lactamase superfamily II)